jgi:hypothetical protein
MLPRINAIGKARGWHRMVTHWVPDQVAEAYDLVTRTPATNGQPR